MDNVAEIWRSVNGKFEGWPYEVSNLGRFRRIGKTKCTAFKRTKNGYLMVRLSLGGVESSVLIQRLVLSAFVRPPVGGLKECQANHRDGDKSNNRIENLEWMTAKENLRHAVDIGLLDNSARDRRKFRNFTDEQVRAIRESKENEGMLARLLNVSMMTIRFIRRRKTYRNVA